MAITMGFMLRVDNYPTAVALPPLQHGIRPVSQNIEAQKIIEPTSTLRSSSQNHLLQRSAIVTGLDSPLTYTAKAAARGTGQLASGQLLNIYA